MNSNLKTFFEKFNIDLNDIETYNKFKDIELKNLLFINSLNENELNSHISNYKINNNDKDNLLNFIIYGIDNKLNYKFCVLFEKNEEIILNNEELYEFNYKDVFKLFNIKPNKKLSSKPSENFKHIYNEYVKYFYFMKLKDIKSLLNEISMLYNEYINDIDTFEKEMEKLFSPYICIIKHNKEKIYNFQIHNLIKEYKILKEKYDNLTKEFNELKKVNNN